MFTYFRFHPDKNKDPTAEDMFKKITGAYSVLSDSVSTTLFSVPHLCDSGKPNRH